MLLPHLVRIRRRLPLDQTPTRPVRRRLLWPLLRASASTEKRTSLATLTSRRTPVCCVSDSSSRSTSCASTMPLRISTRSTSLSTPFSSRNAAGSHFRPSERADVRNRSSFPRRRLPCALGSLIHLTLLFDLFLSSSAISKTPPSVRSPKNALQRPEQPPRLSTATARSTAESHSTNRPLPLPTRLVRPTRQGSSANLSQDRRRTLDCLRRNLCWRRGRIRPTSAIGCWPRWAGTKGKVWVCREKGGSIRFRRRRSLQEPDWELRSPRQSVPQVGREAKGGRTLGRPRSRCVLPLPLSTSLPPLLPLSPCIPFQSLLLRDTLFDLRSRHPS